MYVRKYLSGGWPRHGANYTELWRILRKLHSKNGKWGKTRILGFPSMSPHPLGIKAFQLYQPRHTNAILTHTRGDGEKGFKGVQKLERSVIAMLADMLGAKHSRTAGRWPWNVDGYITSGGTEANMMGLWIGREKLRREIESKGDQRIAVLASPASHYSLWKVCNVLDLGEGKWHDCDECKHWTPQPTVVKHHFVTAVDGSGLHLVRCNPSGEIDVL